MKIKNPDDGEHSFKFSDGSIRNVAELESVFIGRGVYRAGWKWSKDVGPQTSKPSERHIGYIISGSFGISNSQGEEIVVGAGEAFEIGPNHDAWVIGDKPCVALDFISK